MKRPLLASLILFAALSTAAAAMLLEYPQQNWNPKMKALLEEPGVWVRPGWRDRYVVDPPPGLQDTLAEVEVLMSMKSERPENAQNIALEDSYVGSRYYRFLGIETYTHSRTYALIDEVVDEAAVVVMHFKNRFNRARPWEYEPALEPIISPPGHPAYPSGHSTQAHTLSMVLARVVPQVSEELESLAYEIARNREIGGVHYASDSAAGRQLAEQIVADLLASEDFKDRLAQASAEFAE